MGQFSPKHCAGQRVKFGRIEQDLTLGAQLAYQLQVRLAEVFGGEDGVKP